VILSVREDVLTEQIRQFFAARIFGPDRATLLARQLPAGAAQDAARREKQTARLRKRLTQIDATEDAHVREVQALTGMEPHSAAVTAMRTRHLKRFTELEAEREDIGRTLAALARQATQETGGDPGLLDRVPMLGDILERAPDRLKQKLIDAFDIQALYNKGRQPDHPLGHHHPIDPRRAGRDHRRQRDPRPGRPAHRSRSSFGFGTPPWSSQSAMITKQEEGRGWPGTWSRLTSCRWWRTTGIGDRAAARRRAPRRRGTGPRPR
jgi:hypothetical protein